MPDTAPAKLLLLGTGTFAQEVADLVSDVPSFKLTGFIASTPPYQPGDTLLGLPVYWVDELPRFAETHLALCALVTTKRIAFIEQALALGMRFATFVHPSARVSRQAQLDPGVIVSAGAVVSTQTHLGAYAIVNRGALIGHHNDIGAYSTVGPGANLAGNVTLGTRVWVGMGALVVEKTTIGSQSVIGAGALVIANVPDRVQVIGSPARIFQRDIEGE